MNLQYLLDLEASMLTITHFSFPVVLNLLFLGVLTWRTMFLKRMVKNKNSILGYKLDRNLLDGKAQFELFNVHAAT